MAPTKEDHQRVKLLNVRASFLHAFEPQEQKNDDGTSRFTYNCAFMLPKNAPETTKTLKLLKRASIAAKIDKWGPDESKWPHIPSHRICLRDGDNPDHYDPTKRPEYVGHYIVSVSSGEDRPPQILTNRMDDDGDWIVAQRGQKGSPYSGCWCNAVIRVWAQDNKHGKRINAAFDIVQFRKDGEAFTQAAPVNASDYLSEDDVSYEGDMDGDYGSDDALI